MSLFLGLLGLFLFLFLVFIVFLVVLFSSGGGNNQLISLFGLDPTLIQPLIQFIIGLVFGTTSFAALVVFLVGMFRRFTSAPAETEKRKQSLIMAVVSGIVLSILVIFWIILSVYVSQLQFTTQGADEILTDPTETINVVAPLTVKFSAGLIEELHKSDGVVAYAWDLNGDKSFDDGTGRDLQYSYTDKGKNNGVFNVGVKVSLATGKDVVVNKLITIANVLPEPVINYDPKILAVPLEVSFDASKSTDDGSVVAYEWDFNDDGIIDSKEAKTKWSFTSSGEHGVLLRVTDNNGAKAEKTQVLDFKAALEKKALIVVRPGTTGDAPFRASFDASDSSIGDRIQSYVWDFGDKSLPSQGKVVEHEYKVPGEYAVHLKVQGAAGDIFEADEKITVTRPTNAPTAVIKVKDQTIVGGVLKGVAPLKLAFDATASTDKDGKIVEYDWDFESDGTRDAVGDKVEHDFVEGKSYDVTLTVIDDDNLSGTAKLTVDVKTPELVIDLQVSNSTGPVPLEVTFDASASRADQGKIISYTWDFGDKSPGIIGSARQNHIYNAVGEYTATVSVLTDLGKRGSKSIIVVAREIELIANFTVNPLELKAGEKVFFNAEGSQGQISRYYWEFGDGTISRVVKPDHIYAKPGSYTVKLEIYDRKDRVSRKEQVLVVE